jgi:hypothetical protein
MELNGRRRNGSTTVGRPNCELIKRYGSKDLQARAMYFKRLAVGAADPKFAAKLQVLVDEYEGEAARMEREAEMSDLPAV